MKTNQIEIAMLLTMLRFYPIILKSPPIMRLLFKKCIYSTESPRIILVCGICYVYEGRLSTINTLPVGYII